MKKISLFAAAMLLFVINALTQTINDFYSTPSTIPCGGSANIWWEITSASSVYISGGTLAMYVPTIGSTTQTGLIASTSYTLTASGAGGGSVSQTITVNVIVSYDTVLGTVFTKEALPKEILYHFITLDTLYLIDSGKVIVRDSAVVTVSAMDTLKTTSNRTYRRNTCTEDTVTYWTTSTTMDTVNGSVSFDTVHFQTIKIIPVGIDGILSESKEKGVVIFPNPSRGAFTISQRGKWNVTIADIYGKAVYIESGNNETQVTTDLAPGMYILSVISEKGVYSQRIIIQ